MGYQNNPPVWVTVVSIILKYSHVIKIGFTQPICKVTDRQIEKMLTIIGKLSFASSVISARVFLRRIIDLLPLVKR